MNFPKLNVDDVSKLLLRKRPRRIEKAGLLFGPYLLDFIKFNTHWNGCGH